jgi:Flp pilus assembly protein TadG
MSIPQMQNRLRHIAARAGFLKHETGSALIEFSISLLFFLVIIFAAMELCSAAYTYTVLADAANEGVHYAIRNSSDETGAISRVKGYATSSFHNVSNINVSVTYPDGAATPPNRIAVSVSYPYVPYLGIVMNNPPTMHAFAEGRMVH